ncbi:MAG: hypothetical protein EHM58_13595 [Ignavibacteriae bacterium]|nr:MAG: hypothetical protein EHM58_13595 [Ignavibacteriota bacterium]
MFKDYSGIDFHKFVDERLAEKELKILLLNKEIVENKIDDYMNFINTIRDEFKDVYGWYQESHEYMLNSLIDKWKYSYAVLNKKDELLLVNFSSLYHGDTVHMHFTYARKDVRSSDLGKLHMIKLCQTAVDNNVPLIEGFFPKYNNGSVILHLKMGWRIETLRNDRELLIQAKPEFSRNKVYELVNKLS